MPRQCTDENAVGLDPANRMYHIWKLVRIR